MNATPASAPDDDFAQLPLDPDVEVVEAPPGPPVPVHLRPAYLAVVFVGGAAGTAAREGLGLVIPSTDGVPWAILAANLSGALLLGVLLEALVRRGDDFGLRRTLRLLLGTGFMGGFTTYSALATDTAALFGAGHGWLAAAYGLGTVVVGALATTAGILVAAAAHRARFGTAEGVAG
jgi:CrcB protein